MNMRSIQDWLMRAAGILVALSPLPLYGQVEKDEATFYLDFSQPDDRVELRDGARFSKIQQGTVLEFTAAHQSAVIEFSHKLDGIQAMTLGGWFLPRRSGEQTFIGRGMPEIAPLGERMFRPKDDWVNFTLGTDQRGFFLGTIHGNGAMPFPLVTLCEPLVHFWHQLVVVKTTAGFQRFYHNGALVHTDRQASAAGKVRPFRDTSPGEPIRLSMPLGGLIGEAWIVARELSDAEILEDFSAKKERYHPAVPGRAVKLREMNAHPTAGLWQEKITKETWPKVSRRISQAAIEVLGASPRAVEPLEPLVHGEEDCGSYVRRKVSIAVQPNDRMPAYVLIPKKLLDESEARVRSAPAILCFYGTTSGAGKETTVGLSGGAPGTPPDRNRSFAIDIVEAGIVAFAADYLRDGERVAPGRRPYDTTDFYEKFPDWSLVGKDVWDNSRAIDYLETLPFVDARRIGMVGHSYGGHSTIFAAALEPRIRVVVANGPVSDFIHHGMHWGVPRGAGNSQSLPGMRPYVLNPTLPPPITFYQFTSLIAPRPLLVGQAVGEQRPMEEENYAAVQQVYRALGSPERVRYHWYAGDHDFPPEARRAAVRWFERWLPADD